MITCTLDYKHFKFPVGEPHIQLAKHHPVDVDIIWEFENAGEIMELLLLRDALVRNEHTLGRLYIPYVPFSRQDREVVIGEPLSIAVMCSLINSMQAQRVIITDPHSDVTPALLNNCAVIEQHEVFKQYFPIGKPTFLISPDGGALKKIFKLSQLTHTAVIECSKIRNTNNGEIIGTYIPPQHIFTHMTCVIVDDICDGGRTFIELAKVLRERGAQRIILMVTHGFMTKGLNVFDGLIDEIYTRKGRVK